jgi:hypothetical protein
MRAKASACCVMVFLFLVAAVAMGAAAADPAPQPPDAGLAAEIFGPGDCAGSGEQPAASSSITVSPLDGAVPAASLPECGYGREYAGCCTGLNKTKWQCAEFCCKNGSCGLLCPRVWCEFPCML